MHYTYDELIELGFAKVGNDCLISKKASFYGISRITLGNNVRIDDFCVLSAGKEGIVLGDFVHIAVFSSLIGQSLIKLDSYTNISSRVSIYSSSDDYSGDYMTNPMVPAEFTNVTHGPVYIAEHVIIGSGTVILPNVTCHIGAAVGALSLVASDVPEFTIVAGVPVKQINQRSKAMLDQQKRLESSCK